MVSHDVIQIAAMNVVKLATSLLSILLSIYVLTWKRTSRVLSIIGIKNMFVFKDPTGKCTSHARWWITWCIWGVYECGAYKGSSEA